MKQINELSKSDSYLENLDMDKLIKSVQTSLACTPKIATAVAKLISSKIYLELVCEEEDSQEDDFLKVKNKSKYMVKNEKK